MAERSDIILKDLEIQWNDHFHMRDQTWKTLQYSILMFLGVIGLEIREVQEVFMRPAYLAVAIVSLLGLIVALHHRRRQHEKFQIILRYERELKLDELIGDILADSKSSLLGKVNTGVFIVAAQLGLVIISLFLLVRSFLV